MHDKVKRKIMSFAHSEFNKREFTSADHIKNCMENNRDLFNRKKKYRVVDVYENAPECIDYFIERYPHLVKDQYEKVS